MNTFKAWKVWTDNGWFYFAGDSKELAVDHINHMLSFPLENGNPTVRRDAVHFVGWVEDLPIGATWTTAGVITA